MCKHMSELHFFKFLQHMFVGVYGPCYLHALVWYPLLWDMYDPKGSADE